MTVFITIANWFRNLSPRWMVLIVAASVFAVIILFGWMFGNCGDARNRNRLNEINADQSNINAGITVIEGQKTETKSEVKNAQQNSNNANAAFSNSVLRDSNNFDGNRAANRFCERFPADSTCKEWRRLHNR